MNEQKFTYGDKVAGYLDGFAMATGEVVDIDLNSEFPYMIRANDGSYPVFTEDELEFYEGTE